MSCKRKGSIVVKKQKLSKKSKSFIAEVSDVTKRLSADKAEVDHELASGNEKALKLIQDIPPWAYFYSLSSKVIAAIFLDCLGYKDKLIELAASEGKQNANMTIAREMFEVAESEEFYDEFDQLEHVDQCAFLSLFFALLGNLEGLKRFNQTVSDMVAAAPHDHKSLFRAVAIDRTVVANPIIAKEIGLAALRQDESFMNRLAKAITRTIPMPIAKLDDTRLMIEILDEVVGLESISYEQISEVLLNDLSVYPGEGKDPEASIKKLLQRRKKNKGT